MKNICIAFTFAIALFYGLFSIVCWSFVPGDWSTDARFVYGVLCIVFWIAFWMKIEADRVVW